MVQPTEPMRKTQSFTAMEERYGVVKMQVVSEPKLIPIAPRFITKLPEMFEVNSDDIIQFEVQVEANPEAAFQWFINGFELKQSSNVTIDNSVTNRSAVMLQPGAKTGEYKVIARNSYGYSISITTVHVNVVYEDPDLLAPEFIETAVSVHASSEDLSEKRSVDSFETAEHAHFIKQRKAEQAFSVKQLKKPPMLPMSPKRTTHTEQQTQQMEMTSSFEVAQSSFMQESTSSMKEYEMNIQQATLSPRTTRKFERGVLVSSPVPPQTGKEVTEMSAQYSSVQEVTMHQGVASTKQYHTNIQQATLSPKSQRKFEQAELRQSPFAQQTALSSSQTSLKQEVYQAVSSTKDYQTVIQQATMSPKTQRKFEQAVLKEAVFDETEQQMQQLISSIKDDTQEEVEIELPMTPQPESKTVKVLPRKPSIVEEMEEELVVDAGTELTLQIDVDAMPECKFTWYINGFEVRKTNRTVVETEHNHSKLVISEPKEGIYSVKATNQLGSLTRSFRVVVNYPTASQITEEKVETEKMEKSEQMVAMAVGKPPPGPGISTLKKTGQPPIFTKSLLPETTFNVGEELRMVVQVTAEPPADFQWYINGTLMNSTHHVMITSETANTSMLYISKMILKEGEIAVEARNFHGVVWSKTRLMGAKKPTMPLQSTTQKLETSTSLQQSESVFRQLPTKKPPPKAPKWLYQLQPEVIITPNKQFTTAVEVEQDAPPCLFTWLLNNEEISERPHVKIESSTHHSRITLEKVTLESRGYLTVVARNSHGLTKSIMLIKVLKSQL